MSDVRVIIAGGGRVGLQAGRNLDDLGHSVTIIESDPERCAEISGEYVATVIEGDATDPDILRQANLENADVLAGLTGRTGVNLGVCLLADRLTDLRTVVRVDSARAATAYEGLVDGVIFPERLGGLGAANLMAGMDMRALEDVTGDLDIFEIRVTEDAPVASKRLRNISLPRGSLVVSDADESRVAGPKTRIEPNGLYIVAAEPDVADEVRQLFRG